MVAHLRKLVSSLVAITAFKSKYMIPNQISIELVRKHNFCIEKTEKGMPFPFIAIVEGGVRFPLHSFLLKFLHHHNNICISNFVCLLIRVLITYFCQFFYMHGL